MCHCPMKRARPVSPEEDAEHQAKLARLERHLAEGFPLADVIPEIQQLILHRMSTREIGRLTQAGWAFARADFVAFTMRELCRTEWRSPIEPHAVYSIFGRYEALWTKYLELARLNARLAHGEHGPEWIEDPGRVLELEARFWTRAYFAGSRLIRLVMTILSRDCTYRFQPTPQTFRAVLPFDPRDMNFEAPAVRFAEWLAPNRNPHFIEALRSQDYRHADDDDGQPGDLARNGWLVCGDPVRRAILRGDAPTAIIFLHDTASRELGPHTPQPRPTPHIRPTEPKQYMIPGLEHPVDGGGWNSGVPNHVAMFTRHLPAGEATFSIGPFIVHPGRRVDLRIQSNGDVINADGRIVMRGEFYGAWEPAGEHFIFNIPWFVSAIDLDALLAVFQTLSRNGPGLYGLARLSADPFLNEQQRPLGRWHWRLWSLWMGAASTLGADAHPGGDAMRIFGHMLINTELGGIECGLVSMEELVLMRPPLERRDAFIQRMVETHFLAETDEGEGQPVVFREFLGDADIACV